jgi:membrane-bound serine protease (ClpP class)
MCHVILLLPLLSLPVFWVWPLAVAAPVYGVILTVSIWTYVFTMRAMRCPVETGSEGLRHEVGRVIEAKARVRIHSETWNAVSSEPLRKGDLVRVVGIDGLTLQVAKIEATG